MKLYAVRKKSGGWLKWSAPTNTPILTETRIVAGALSDPDDTVVPVEVTIVESKPKPKPKRKAKAAPAEAA